MYALVAEPDNSISFLIAAVLIDLGFCVLATKDSRQVPTAVQKLQPTLIFLDLSLSHQGRPLLESIIITNSSGIPIVGMDSTALSDDAIIQRGLDGFLAKPFHSDALRNCLKRYLSTDGDSTLLCREV